MGAGATVRGCPGEDAAVVMSVGAAAAVEANGDTGIVVEGGEAGSVAVKGAGIVASRGADIVAFAVGGTT